jgi:hypothetical protein
MFPSSVKGIRPTHLWNIGANVVMPIAARQCIYIESLVLTCRPDQRGRCVMLGTLRFISPPLITTRRRVSPSSHASSGRISAALPLLAQAPPTLAVHTDTPPSPPTSALFLSGFSRAGCSPRDSHLKLYLPLLARGRCRSQPCETLACQGTTSVADCRGAWLVGRRG